MRKKNLIILFLGVVAIVLLIYILDNRVIKNSISSINGSKKLQVTASFYPLYYFATQIGGDKADIRNITPAGAEPHDYEPTAQDIARIENSNMLILNGGIEAWGDKIKQNLSGKNVLIVVAGEGLLTRKLTENGQTSSDPHVWLDPKVAKIEAGRIAQEFIKIDPASSSFYQNNEKQLDSKLDELDQAYKKGLANCKQKDIITSHAAFGYLGKEYGLNQVSVAGLSPDEEPSAQQLTDVSNFAKQRHIKYIFFESLVSPKLSDTIATEVGAQTLVLDPLEGISDTDMGKGRNYFTVMQDNLKNLQIALECSTQ